LTVIEPDMKNTTITFLGCGNMGQCLIGGLIADGHDPAAIRAADPDPAKREQVSQRYDIEVFADNAAAVRRAAVVVLAVKPQVLMDTLTGLGPGLEKQPPLILSVAAGIRLAGMEAVLGRQAPIVRAMPNTPALIRAGATALCANRAVTATQRELAEGILRSVGVVIWLDDEALMDTVTALSGSGPAYFFLLIEVLEKAAVALGLPAEPARLLTIETAFGAARMALESDTDAAELRRRVTSPGGTTEQALKVLMERGRFGELFLDALAAAKQRSEQLAESGRLSE